MADAPDAYGVIGHPVGHSWSPFIHGLFARQTGQNMIYRLHDVPPADFRGHVGAFFESGGKGLNVTLPHKPAAADFANDLTPRAALAGAVNTLVLQDDHRLLGDNTDGIGLVRDLQDNLHFPLARKRILLIGAGGAARGVLGPLLGREPSEIVVANRKADRARQLVAQFAALGSIRGCGLDEIASTPVDLVINATAAGLSGEVPGIGSGVIGPDTLCYDLTYSRGDTPFVRWASKAGCSRAVQGWGMLVEQAAESFLLWRGVRPDTAAVLTALKSHPAAMARAG